MSPKLSRWLVAGLVAGFLSAAPAAMADPAPAGNTHPIVAALVKTLGSRERAKKALILTTWVLKGLRVALPAYLAWSRSDDVATSAEYRLSIMQHQNPN